MIHILLFLNYSFKESPKEETKKDNEKSEVKFVKLVQEKVLQEQTAKSVELKINEPKIVEQKQQNIKTPKIVEKEQKASSELKANNSKKQLDIKEAKKVQKEILKESSNLHQWYRMSSSDW